jgi:hypothetical protein
MQQDKTNVLALALGLVRLIGYAILIGLVVSSQFTP